MRRILALVVLALGLATPVAAQITINYTFVAGTVADPDQVNDNFTQLSTRALNRTGGTVTGAITSTGGTLVGTWGGTPTFSGAVVFSGAPSFTGAPSFSGNPTFSGNPVFSGTPSFSGSLAVGGTLNVTGATTLQSTLAVTGSTALQALSVAGNASLGDNAADTVSIFGTFVTDLRFTDASFDIGKSGATRPRDGFFSRDLTAGGNLTVTGTAGITGAATFSAPITLGATSGQIAFPAVQNAAAGVNTLDDYEEGAWTPTDTSGVGVSITVASARYIKIGKMVWVMWDIVYGSTGSGLPSQMGGFPFAQASGVTAGTGCYGANFTAGTAISFGMNSGGTTGVYSNNNAIVPMSVVSSKGIRCSMVYEATA